MAVLQPPPTYTLPVIIDEETGKSQFNPVWLKWFVDLVQVLNDAGGIGGFDHNLLSGLQGGLAPSQFYHLDLQDYTDLLFILHTRVIGAGESVTVSENATVVITKLFLSRFDSVTVTESITVTLV